MTIKYYQNDSYNRTKVVVQPDDTIVLTQQRRMLRSYKDVDEVMMSKDNLIKMVTELQTKE